MPDLNIPFISTRIIKDLKYVILLIPLWWILGVNFFIFHFIVLLLFIKLLAMKFKKSERIYFPNENFFILIFIMIYIISIFINIRETPFPRLLGSLYNLSFWIMGFFIIMLIYNSIKKEHILIILQTFRNFGAISCVFVLFFLLFWSLNNHYLEIESLLSKILPAEFIVNKAPLIKASFLPTIVTTNWIFNKPFPRLSGFNVYSTALGATMLFIIAMTLAYYKIRKNRKGFKTVLLLELLVLFLSLSRAAIFGFFLPGLLFIQ